MGVWVYGHPTASSDRTACAWFVEVRFRRFWYGDGGWLLQLGLASSIHCHRFLGCIAVRFRGAWLEDDESHYNLD